MAVHRAKKHGIKAQIPTLVQSAVCPGCLKFMWTSARVIQHLRYRPNRCLDRVSASRIPKEHFAVELPDHLRRVKRLPCAREHHGPLLPLPHEKERVEMRERLRACEDHGAKYDYWSKVNPALTMLAASKFTVAANHWLDTDPDNGEELYSALLEAMARLPYPERVQEKCLIHWIEFSMWDACSEWPPTALETLEKEHQHILANLPIWTLRMEREQLQRMLQSDAPPVDRIPQPQGHQPHPSKHKRAQAVGTSYTDLEQMELYWRAMVFAHTPTPRIPSMSDNVFYIVHLYSGRRRLHDLQWQMEQLLGPWNGRIKVISIDTAVHSMCDINDPVFWHHILSLAKSGYLLGLMMGPPCETWSAVRHEALWNDDGTMASGPRPLRDDSRPWGRGGLLPREYRQLRMGMRLLLRGLILGLYTVLSGGISILEHPSASSKNGRASIWNTGIVQLLVQSQLFQTYSFGQWRFHAQGVKPTTFLFGGAPRLPKIMRLNEDREVSKPTCPLKGRNDDGTFKTSVAKEYPPLLNKAIAMCFHEHIPMQLPVGARSSEAFPADLSHILNSLHVACSEIEEHRSFLPDYQGR